MKYFFVLGNNPTLSIAELCSVFKEAEKGIIVSGDIFVIDFASDFNAREMIKKLGGIIKIGKIIKEINSPNQLEKTMTPYLPQKKQEGKYKFGFSIYGKQKINTKKLGMNLKRCLKEVGINSRMVVSRDQALSSVVVEQNKLASKGQEFVFIKNKNKILVGLTEAVQPFKSLSYRDYGRPARDDRSGMLPPKLAQIMINLGSGVANANKEGFIILDPFCGSGTVLTEAMLMGGHNLIGIDNSGKAVHDTIENLEWMRSKYKIENRKYEVYELSVTELSKKIKRYSVDLIVTEPYLGPQRGRIDFDKVGRELEDLYSRALSEFGKVLKTNGRAVMVFPIFRTMRNTQKIMPNLGKLKIVNPIPFHLRDDKNIRLTDRHTIVYGREDQKVWREIILLNL